MLFVVAINWTDEGIRAVKDFPKRANDRPPSSGPGGMLVESRPLR